MTSMLKTLAAKHRSSVSKMAARHKAKIETRDGLRTCFEARKHREGKPDLVARFGGIILKRDRRAVIRDPAPAPAPYPRKELIRRLRRRECELCETGTTVAVHQVTGLKAAREAGTGPARVGRPHGENAAQDAHRLRRLPRLDPREPRRARGINRRRARCPESGHAGFGGRLPGKGPGSSRMNTGPRRAAHPTLGVRGPGHRVRAGLGRISMCTCRTAGRRTRSGGRRPGSRRSWRSPRSRNWPSRRSKRLMAAGLRVTWAAADEVYGRCGEFRAALRAWACPTSSSSPATTASPSPKNKVIRADEAVDERRFRAAVVRERNQGPPLRRLGAHRDRGPAGVPADPPLPGPGEEPVHVLPVPGAGRPARDHDLFHHHRRPQMASRNNVQNGKGRPRLGPVPGHGPGTRSAGTPR